MSYRILSLDGGGVWGLIEVKTLIALYSPETNGHDVLKEFDLVAGNSAGSRTPQIGARLCSWFAGIFAVFPNGPRRQNSRVDAHLTDKKVVAAHFETPTPQSPDPDQESRVKFLQ